MEIGQPNKMSVKALIVTSFFYGMFYILGIALIDWLIHDEVQSLKVYLFSGLFFGIFMGIGMPYVTKWITKRKIDGNKRSIAHPQLLPEEKIEMEGPANLFRGIEAVGGKLFFTNQRLIFNSHKINIQKGQTSILYSDISKVEKRSTLNIIPNRIKVVTRDQKSYHFVVNNREEWLFEFDKRVENSKINLV